MNRKLIVYFVALCAFLGPFTQNIYTPLLPDATETFQTTDFLMNVSVSIFTVFLAIMQIIYGPLVDKKGRKSVLLTGVGIYTLASVGCYFAPSIELFLLFRALQAIGIASGSVVAVTVIGDLFEGKERGRAMGTFQMMVSLGTVVGPVIGGYIGGMASFHNVFLVLVFVALSALIVNAVSLKETKKSDAVSKRFSIKDFGLVFVHPIALAILVFAFIQYYTMYNFIIFIPTILTDIYEFSSEKIGLSYLPLTCGIVVGSITGGRVQEHVKETKLLLIAGAFNGLSILFFTMVATYSIVLLLISTALFGLLVGISLPVQTTLLTRAFVEKRATAVGVYNFVRYIGMSAGPVVGTWLYAGGGIGLAFGFSVALFIASIIFAKNRFTTGAKSR